LGQGANVSCSQQRAGQQTWAVQRSRRDGGCAVKMLDNLGTPRVTSCCACCISFEWKTRDRQLHQIQWFSQSATRQSRLVPACTGTGGAKQSQTLVCSPMNAGHGAAGLELICHRLCV
jgi:hypothetical protein